MNNHVRTAIAAAALTIATSGAALATTTTADYSNGNGKYINVTSSSAGSFGNIFAGNFILEPKAGDDLAGESFITFCVDLAHGIADDVTYQIKSLASSGFSATVQSNINRLFSSFYASLNTDPNVDGGRRKVAAFQVALWEIIDEAENNPFDVTSGVFSVQNQTIRNIAQNMLDNLGPETADWEFTFFDADGNQDQLTAEPGGDGAAVPLPAGLPLLLTAAGGFALIRRGKKKA